MKRTAKNNKNKPIGTQLYLVEYDMSMHPSKRRLFYYHLRRLAARGKIAYTRGTASVIYTTELKDAKTIANLVMDHLGYPKIWKVKEVIV